MIQIVLSVDSGQCVVAQIVFEGTCTILLGSNMQMNILHRNVQPAIITFAII